MRWSSTGWFLGATRWGAGYISAVICKKGVWKGLLYGKSQLTMSHINISWSAKNIEDLGTLKIAYLSEAPNFDFLSLLTLCNIALHWCNERDPVVYEEFINALKYQHGSEATKYFALFAANQWGLGNICTITKAIQTAKENNYKTILT